MVYIQEIMINVFKLCCVIVFLIVKCEEQNTIAEFKSLLLRNLFCGILTITQKKSEPFKYTEGEEKIMKIRESEEYGQHKPQIRETFKNEDTIKSSIFEGNNHTY